MFLGGVLGRVFSHGPAHEFASLVGFERSTLGHVDPIELFLHKLQPYVKSCPYREIFAVS